MENFDFKKYLAEGKLLKEDYKENLGEEYKQFGRSNYKIEVNSAGDRVVNLFSGEEILVQKKGEKQRTDDEITKDIEKTYKPSDGKAEIDREIDDLIKYGKFGQTRREFRPSDEPRYRKR